MEIKIIPDAASEVSSTFIQGMADRMAMSFYKYGIASLAYPRLVDAMKSLELRLDKYKQTGNTEYLIDAANFAMIEFMYPRHPKAFFEPTDSKGSPGRMWQGEVDPSQRDNKL